MKDKEIGKISQQGRCQMTEGVVGQETGEGGWYTRRKDQQSMYAKTKGRWIISLRFSQARVLCVRVYRAEGRGSGHVGNGTRGEGPPKWLSLLDGMNMSKGWQRPRMP
jgi:hypothetical protein